MVGGRTLSTQNQVLVVPTLYTLLLVFYFTLILQQANHFNITTLSPIHTRNYDQRHFLLLQQISLIIISCSEFLPNFVNSHWPHRLSLIHCNSLVYLGLFFLYDLAESNKKNLENKMYTNISGNIKNLIENFVNRHLKTL